LNELLENEKDQEIDFDSVNRENVHNILNSPINEEEINIKEFTINRQKHINCTFNVFINYIIIT
jgi:hypothetical protein